MTYNQATDLQALLDQQKQDKEQLTFTLDNVYESDVTGFIGQVEEQYNAQVAQSQAEAQAATLAAPADQGTETEAQGETGAEGETSAEGETAEGETAAPAETVDPNAPKNAYLQYDTTSTAFVIVPDQPGTQVDWAQVTEQVQTAVLAMEPELVLPLDGGDHLRQP